MPTPLASAPTACMCCCSTQVAAPNAITAVYKTKRRVVNEGIWAQ